MKKEENLLNIFKEDMLNELKKNSHKSGSFLDFKDFNSIITEFEYHKAKLFLAIRTKNKTAIREYLADCGNYLMLIGNLFDVYSEPYDHSISHEINKELELIKRVSIWEQSENQKLI